MLGQPDLTIAGLSIWILDYQFPDAQDFWDGNWLDIIAVVEASGARVEVRGPWLRNSELEQFVQELDAVQKALGGTAKIDSIEPALDVKIHLQSLGHVEVVVQLTPDHLTQDHKFIFRIDQTYLPPIAQACRKILASFPIRARPEVTS